MNNSALAPLTIAQRAHFAATGIGGVLAGGK